MADSSVEAGCIGGIFIIVMVIICGIPIGCISRLEQYFRGTETTNTGTIVATPTPQTRTIETIREVNTINLNMRSGPGNGYSVVATFPKKTKIVSYVETKRVNGELWTQASTPDRQTKGWVNLKYLSP
jgi:SH3-like domain-containing protein